tara:strand:- start:315 stop:845 length:531 start_codon:yes stop_codon:yes gene_type:complete
MVKRIIAIGGEPATGKTTIMKEIIKDYMPFRKFKYGLVRGIANNKLNIVGVYDKINCLFSGTDQLSMAVQPQFLKFVEKCSNEVILFEGDRLFNQSLFDKVDCEIIVIKANKEEVHKRHIQRKDTQTEKFIKAKRTKIENIIQKNKVTIFSNDNNEEQEQIIKHIKTLINEQNRTH